MAHGGHSNAQPARLRAQALTDFHIHHPPAFHDLAAIALHIGQSKRGGRLIHIFQHAGEEGLMLLAAHAQARLRHKVAEGQRRRQTLRLTLKNRLNLFQQRFAGSVVSH